MCLTKTDLRHVLMLLMCQISLLGDLLDPTLVQQAKISLLSVSQDALAVSPGEPWQYCQASIDFK